ncbi:chloride chloride channel family protein [Cystoisospora suis]|uniref:Chloride channel protein n=1 Tax=Cystoisospora suis TaxID=483139 RepID=A0A2C6KQX8_9APIC|nr:chloride chloride channel family protein [Cystoisospora suis]
MALLHEAESGENGEATVREHFSRTDSPSRGSARPQTRGEHRHDRKEQNPNGKPLSINRTRESLPSSASSTCQEQDHCKFQVGYPSFTNVDDHDKLSVSTPSEQKAPFWYSSSSAASDTSPIYRGLPVSAEPPPKHECKLPFSPPGDGQLDSSENDGVPFFFSRSSVFQKGNVDFHVSTSSFLPRFLSRKRKEISGAGVGRSSVYIHCGTQHSWEEACTMNSSQGVSSGRVPLPSRTERHPSSSFSLWEVSISSGFPGNALPPTQRQVYAHHNTTPGSSMSRLYTCFRGISLVCFLPILVILAFTVRMTVCLFTKLICFLRRLLLFYHPRGYRGGKFARAFEVLEVWILAALVGVLTAYSAFYIHHTSNFIGDLRFGICRTFYWLDRRHCCGSQFAVDYSANACMPGILSGTWETASSSRPTFPLPSSLSPSVPRGPSSLFSSSFSSSSVSSPVPPSNSIQLSSKSPPSTSSTVAAAPQISPGLETSALSDFVGKSEETNSSKVSSSAGQFLFSSSLSSSTDSSSASTPGSFSQPANVGNVSRELSSAFSTVHLSASSSLRASSASSSASSSDGGERAPPTSQVLIQRDAPSTSSSSLRSPSSLHGFAGTPLSSPSSASTPTVPPSFLPPFSQCLDSSCYPSSSAPAHPLNNSMPFLLSEPAWYSWAVFLFGPFQESAPVPAPRTGLPSSPLSPSSLPDTTSSSTTVAPSGGSRPLSSTARAGRDTSAFTGDPPLSLPVETSSSESLALSPSTSLVSTLAGGRVSSEQRVVETTAFISGQRTSPSGAASLRSSTQSHASNDSTGVFSSSAPGKEHSLNHRSTEASAPDAGTLPETSRPPAESRASSQSGLRVSPAVSSSSSSGASSTVFESGASGANQSTLPVSGTTRPPSASSVSATVTVDSSVSSQPPASTVVPEEEGSKSGSPSPSPGVDSTSSPSAEVSLVSPDFVAHTSDYPTASSSLPRAAPLDSTEPTKGRDATSVGGSSLPTLVNTPMLSSSTKSVSTTKDSDGSSLVTVPVQGKGVDSFVKNRESQDGGTGDERSAGVDGSVSQGTSPRPAGQLSSVTSDQRRPVEGPSGERRKTGLSVSLSEDREGSSEVGSESASVSQSSFIGPSRLPPSPSDSHSPLLPASRLPSLSPSLLDPSPSVSAPESSAPVSPSPASLASASSLSSPSSNLSSASALPSPVPSPPPSASPVSSPSSLEKTGEGTPVSKGEGEQSTDHMGHEEASEKLGASPSSSRAADLIKSSARLISAEMFLGGLDEGQFWGSVFFSDLLAGVRTAALTVQQAAVSAARVFVDFLFFFGVTVGSVVAAAWIVCTYAPIAAGSGIAEVKVLLCGFRSLSHVLSATVLIVKILGLSLAVGSGLVLGKEGPMVHVACCWAHLLLLFFSPPSPSSPSSSHPAAAALKPQGGDQEADLSDRKKVVDLMLERRTSISSSEQRDNGDSQFCSSGELPSSHEACFPFEDFSLSSCLPSRKLKVTPPSPSCDSFSFSSSPGPTRSSSANAESEATCAAATTFDNCPTISHTHTLDPPLPSSPPISSSPRVRSSSSVLPSSRTEPYSSRDPSTLANEEARRPPSPVDWTHPGDTSSTADHNQSSLLSPSASFCLPGEESSPSTLASSREMPKEFSCFPHATEPPESVGPSSSSSRFSSSFSSTQEKRRLLSPKHLPFFSSSPSSRIRTLPPLIQEGNSRSPFHHPHETSTPQNSATSPPPCASITSRCDGRVTLPRGSFFQLSPLSSPSSPPCTPHPASPFSCEPSRNREQHVVKPLLAAASAAGMSCAFGSPIGGVLFALEEMGASDLPASCLWLCCCSCVSASIVLQILNPESRTSSFTLFSSHNNGGTFLPFSWWKESVALFRTFDLIELLPFAFLGLVGGLIGPAFIWVALKAGKLRKKRMHGKKVDKQENERDTISSSRSIPFSQRTHERGRSPCGPVVRDHACGTDGGRSRRMTDKAQRDFLKEDDRSEEERFGGSGEEMTWKRRHEENEEAAVGVIGGDRRGGSAVMREGVEHQGEQQEEIEQRESMRSGEEEQGEESCGERRRKKGFIGSIQWCFRKYLLQGGPVVDCAVVAACTAIVNFILPMAGASSNDLLENLFSRCSSSGTSPTGAVDRFGMCKEVSPPFLENLQNTTDLNFSPSASDSHHPAVTENTSVIPSSSSSSSLSTPYRLDSGVLFELSLVLVVKFLLAVFTFGLAVPAGIFVPALIIGSLYGRLTGLLVLQLNENYHFMSLDPSPSNYALVGAVSFLCGITRMNLSLVVLMMEISVQASGASNSSAFGVPFLLALGIAKGVSSAICGYSLYDGLIVCKGYPYLFNTHEVSFSGLRAEDVMQKNVKVLIASERRTISDLLHMIRRYPYRGYPVVSDAHQSRLVVGYVSAHRLRLILEKLLDSNHPYLHAHTCVSFESLISLRGNSFSSSSSSSSAFHSSLGSSLPCDSSESSSSHPVRDTYTRGFSRVYTPGTILLVYRPREGGREISEPLLLEASLSNPSVSEAGIRDLPSCLSASSIQETPTEDDPVSIPGRHRSWRDLFLTLSLNKFRRRSSSASSTSVELRPLRTRLSSGLFRNALSVRSDAYARRECCFQARDVKNLKRKNFSRAKSHPRPTQLFDHLASQRNFLLEADRECSIQGNEKRESEDQTTEGSGVCGSNKENTRVGGSYASSPYIRGARKEETPVEDDEEAEIPKKPGSRREDLLGDTDEISRADRIRAKEETLLHVKEGDEEHRKKGGDRQVLTEEFEEGNDYLGKEVEHVVDMGLAQGDEDAHENCMEAFDIRVDISGVAIEQQPLQLPPETPLIDLYGVFKQVKCSVCLLTRYGRLCGLITKSSFVPYMKFKHFAPDASPPPKEKNYHHPASTSSSRQLSPRTLA